MLVQKTHLATSPRGSSIAKGALSLDLKVRFPRAPESYPAPVHNVICRETHMSWVFLAGDKVYKLKKPVRFPYLDFSTLNRREAACRAELSLNHRLGPGVLLSGATPPATTTPGAGRSE